MNHDFFACFHTSLCVCSPSAPASKLRIRQAQRRERDFQGRVWISHKFHERPDFHPTRRTHLISSLLCPPTQVVYAPCTRRTFQARALNATCDASPDSQRQRRLLPLSFPPSRRPVIAWLSPARRCGTDPLLTSLGPT